MEKDVKLIQKLAQAKEMLVDNQNSIIDITQLTSSLTEAEERLTGLVEKDNELVILRDDLIGRISGMAKAIAAVSRNKDEAVKALEFIDELDSLNSKALVVAYGRLSARFRDAFPSTFGTSIRRN